METLALMGIVALLGMLGSRRFTRVFGPYVGVYTCPHCGNTRSVRLTPDLRRCGRCYGRYPEPG